MWREVSWWMLWPACQTVSQVSVLNACWFPIWSRVWNKYIHKCFRVGIYIISSFWFPGMFNPAVSADVVSVWPQRFGCFFSEHGLWQSFDWNRAWPWGGKLCPHRKLSLAPRRQSLGQEITGESTGSGACRLLECVSLSITLTYTIYPMSQPPEERTRSCRIYLSLSAVLQSTTLCCSNSQDSQQSAVSSRVKVIYRIYQTVKYHDINTVCSNQVIVTCSTTDRSFLFNINEKDFLQLMLCVFLDQLVYEI